MRFLASSLILLFLGCTPYPKKLGYKPLENDIHESINPYFSDSQKDYVYKANITVFDNRFGGILVIKKLDNTAHRIAFTTEFGNTIFDFTLSDQDFKVNRILKEMDRRILLNVLEQDFRTLIREEITLSEMFAKDNKVLTKAKIGSKLHFYKFENDTLSEIIRVGNQKKKVTFEFSEIKDSVARHIQITHYNIKLTISLQAIR